jgi:hypothetical protein
VYQKQRRELSGTPLARHSMNQKVMKRIRHRERGFYKDDGREKGTSPIARAPTGVPLLDQLSLTKLVRTGVFGDGPTAELDAIAHTIGGLLNRVRPLQTANGG